MKGLSKRNKLDNKKNINSSIKQLKDSSVLYQWETCVIGPKSAQTVVDIMAISTIFFLVILGYSLDDIEEWDHSIMLSTLGLVLAAYVKFIWFAPFCYKYKLTNEGISFTKKQNVPNFVYTVVRIFAYFAIIVCIAAVILVGPSVLIGAGVFALMAFKIRNFEPETIEDYIFFASKYSIFNIQNEETVVLVSHPYNIFCSKDIYCGEYKEEVINQLSTVLTDYKIHEVQTYKQHHKHPDKIAALKELRTMYNR